MTDEELRRLFDETNRRIDQTAADTRHEFKVIALGMRSEVQLDRRMSTLEVNHKALQHTVAELHARVERLESKP